MAPERFVGRASGPLTPASDIFAWGAVIAYAATGQSPFGAEIPAAIAVRIMNEPPDLSGMSGPLRDLVGQSLAKNPGERPTARERIARAVPGDLPPVQIFQPPSTCPAPIRRRPVGEVWGPRRAKKLPKPAAKFNRTGGARRTPHRPGQMAGRLPAAV